MSDLTVEKKFKRRKIIAVLTIAVLTFGGLGFAFRSAIRDGVESILGNSYPGPGHGEVSFVVLSGETGENVAQNLVDEGIVKQFRSFYRLILDSNSVFYPGTYPMKYEMANADALALLSNFENSVTNRVTIKEGWTSKQTFSALSKATGVTVSAFESASASVSKYGLPEAALNVEGYLFPATYAFDPNLQAEEILQIMVDRMFQELADLGVSKQEQFERLTFASIIQKEARLAPDFGKVARVFANRIAHQMPLQSDATVSYGTGGTTVTTTDEQRADPNGYNTYVHLGLPIGPISNPGRDAILAAGSPTAGDWLYFCTVNLETGETIFSSTYAQHLIAVRQFQAWIRENPSWNG